MKPLHPLFAALMLVVWLFVGAHMAQEHGGDLTGACVTCTHCYEGYEGYEEGSAPADGHHHHDLGAVAAGKAVTAQKAPLAAPLYDQLLAQFTALFRQAGAAQTFGDSPPDERASGWLLVARTALPVRGPSLTA